MSNPDDVLGTFHLEIEELLEELREEVYCVEIVDDKIQVKHPGYPDRIIWEAGLDGSFLRAKNGRVVDLTNPNFKRDFESMKSDIKESLKLWSEEA